MFADERFGSKVARAVDDDDAKVFVGRRAKDGDAHDPAAVMEAVMMMVVVMKKVKLHFYFYCSGTPLDESGGLLAPSARART